MAPPLNLSASRVARLRDALTSPADAKGDLKEVELHAALADPTVRAVAITLPLHDATGACTLQVFRHSDQFAQWIQLASI